jgi:hypothetical protein
MKSPTLPRTTNRLPSPTRLGLALILVSCASSAYGQIGVTAVPIEGDPFAGAFEGIDSDWKITFQTEAGLRDLPAADLVRWGTPPDLSRGPMIVLADGGVLLAEVRAIEGEELIADSILFGDVRLPLARVRGVIFQPPPDRLERDRLLDRVLTATGSRDRLLLQNGDVMEGQLTSAGRQRQGPPAPQEEIRLETIKMQGDSGAMEAPIDRVAAITFNPSLVRAPQHRGLRAWIGLADEGLLMVQQVESKNGVTSISLPGGDRLRTDDAGFRDAVQFVQPLGGRAVYLSDLTPLGYRHIPYLTIPWDYGRDRNVLGGALRAGGQSHIKGLGMHSTSRIAYRIDGDYQRLKAEIAIDDSAGRDGSVIYRVYTSGDSGQWQSAYESSVIRGGEPPTPISVNIRGAKGIALIVEHADRGDIQDHANWLDARLE